MKWITSSIRTCCGEILGTEKKNCCGLRAPYNDPELVRGTRYAHFVKELAARGIIEFVDAKKY